LLLLSLVKLAGPLLLSFLEDLVSRLSRDGGTWLRTTLGTAAAVDPFTSAFAGASRHVGRSAIAVTPDDVAELRGLGVTWSLARWAVDDLARAALLVRASDVLDASSLQAVVDRAYRNGDTRERQAILRALPLLPYPERTLALAIEAARAGVPPVFEAIACENPYPAAHFPAMNFNHMVLSALLTGVALQRIVSLGARVTPELVRVVNDWVAERRAAGRSVPADLDYIADATRAAA
jgi:hypothetical protein